ncbi:hypothetical protein Tco_0530382 [Tanacetum coccineum]
MESMKKGFQDMLHALGGSLIQSCYYNGPEPSKDNARSKLEYKFKTRRKNGQVRNKKYAELTKQEKLQDDCDVQAINIVLQGLSPDVYALVDHCKSAKDIWERVKLLMKGTKLSYQERECKLYNEFDKFTSVKGETLHEYYLRFV